MPASSRHSGWRWDETNSRLSCYVRGTEVMRVDDTSADLALLVNGISGLGTTTGVGFGDDALLALGTNDDIVMWNQSTALSAGVEVANAIVGSSVLADIPANSLIVSDITADGDLVFVGRTGANSLEYVRADASALELVVNEASNDIDFRVESDGDANAIFVNAGNSRVGILNGSPGVAFDITGAMTGSGIVSTDEWQTTGGGTVTQATSKNTGFTLNTTAGVITMSSSQIDAGGETSAVWTNSTINTNSIVAVNHAASGAGDAEAYWVGIGNVQDGSCELLLHNLSGGNLSNAIQVNFVVIGGASS